MKTPVQVAVTGAAGQIAYSILFRIASGEMLGPDQPVVLRCLEITSAMQALVGVAMEIEDCAFPLVEDIILTDDPNEAFKGADIAMLIGARPRGAGMERSDLLKANGGIFKIQGEALNKNAKPDVKVVVVGNPANTNAHTAMRFAPDLNPRNFTALTRLDHNRALSQLADKTKSNAREIKKMIVWGNHSTTQYPDISHVTVAGKAAFDMVDQAWNEFKYIPHVAQRGAEIIAARGASSAASAANGAIEHIRDWVLGTPEGDWTSMAVPSDGSYGIPKGLMYSFPVRCKDSDYEIVQGLKINDFSQSRMNLTQKELEEERDAIKELVG